MTVKVFAKTSSLDVRYEDSQTNLLHTSDFILSNSGFYWGLCWGLYGSRQSQKLFWIFLPHKPSAEKFANCKDFYDLEIDGTVQSMQTSSRDIKIDVVITYWEIFTFNLLISERKRIRDIQFLWGMIPAACPVRSPWSLVMKGLIKSHWES